MTNQERFTEIFKSQITRSGSGDLFDWIEKSDFFIAPASTKYHGSYDGGLCEHSLNVYDALVEISEHYPEENIPEESIAITALCHDICKCNFYKKGFRNVKDDETGQWYKKDTYEIEDSLPIGHGEKSCILVQNFIKLTPNEMYAIRWHMGSFDSAVKGGDMGMTHAYEKSKLAVILHLADMTATYLKECKDIA